MTVFRTYCAALLILCALPADADPAWRQFFDAPGAVIERCEDGQREAVQLPGDVQVVRERQGSDWTYIGIDRSDAGAVGCVSRVLMEINRVSSQCPSFLDAAHQVRLSAYLDRLSDFFAANAVPDVSAEGFLARVGAYAAQDPQLQCADITEDFKRFALQLTDPASEALVDELLGVPRLPVLNPCF